MNIQHSTLNLNPQISNTKTIPPKIEIGAESRLAWLNKPEPGTAGANLGDKVRDVVSLTATSALVAGGTTLIASLFGVGVFESAMLAGPALFMGAGIGTLASALSQEGLGALVGAEPDHNAQLRSGMTGMVIGALGAGAGALAAGFGIDPMMVAMTAAGVGGGLMALDAIKA